MKTVYGLIGAGGHGREVMPMLRSMIQKELAAGIAELAFVIEESIGVSEVNGYRVITLDQFFKLPNPKKFNVAIGDSRARARIAEECLRQSLEPVSIVAEGAILLDCNEVGIGAMLSSQAIITSNVKVGKFFHANCQSNIAHDCVIGDYVTFGPGAKCNGNVVIEDHAYIGAGALIIQGAKNKPTLIGEGAVVGMGAVVIRNVPRYTTVVGNPARILRS